MFSHFASLKGALLAEFPTLVVTGNAQPPRMSAFEVTTSDGKLLHSKLESFSYPENEVIIARFREHLKELETSKQNVPETQIPTANVSRSSLYSRLKDPLNLLLLATTISGIIAFQLRHKFRSAQ